MRWQDVVARWTAGLAPGIGSGAAHGAIRTGHAVRSLAEQETPERLREVGEAFGYWASCYATLPVADYPGKTLPAREAIALVPFSPGKARSARGSFSAGLRSLDEFPDFAPAIGMLDVSGDAAKTLSELTETFTRVYLTNAHDPYTVIAFIHGVTAIAALRSLAPYLDAAAGARGLALWLADRRGALFGLWYCETGLACGRCARRNAEAVDRGGRGHGRRSRHQIHGSLLARICAEPESRLSCGRAACERGSGETWLDGTADFTFWHWLPSWAACCG